MRKRYKKNILRQRGLKQLHTRYTHTKTYTDVDWTRLEGWNANLSVFSQMAANTFNKFQIVIYRSEDNRGPVVSEIIPPLELSLLSVKVSLNIDSSSDVATHSKTQESHCKPPSPFNMVEERCLQLSTILCPTCS